MNESNVAAVEGKEKIDAETLLEEIRDVFRKYFEADDFGIPNPQFDDCYYTQDAFDDIRDIVGEFHAKPA